MGERMMRRPTYAREHEAMGKLEAHYFTTYTLAEWVPELERQGCHILAEAARASLAGEHDRCQELVDEWKRSR